MQYKIDITLNDAQDKVAGDALVNHLVSTLRLIGVEGTVQVECKASEDAAQPVADATAQPDGEAQDQQAAESSSGLPAPFLDLIKKLGGQAAVLQLPKLPVPALLTQASTETDEVLRPPLVSPDAARRANETAAFHRGAKLHAVQSAWLEFENQVSSFYEVDMEQWQSMHPMQKQLMIQKIWQSDGMQLDQPVLM